MKVMKRVKVMGILIGSESREREKRGKELPNERREQCSEVLYLAELKANSEEAKRYALAPKELRV